MKLGLESSLETADGLIPDYTGSQNGAFTKVNGQYVNGEGTAIEGALFRGISVSKYQQDIDWQAVASDDINFAFIRMGYVDDLDPYFDVNMREAAAAGIHVGTYLYSQALTVEDAVKEAQFAVEDSEGIPAFLSHCHGRGIQSFRGSRAYQTAIDRYCQCFLPYCRSIRF